MYNDWAGWAIWLGHDPLPGIMADTDVLFMGRVRGVPNNVYMIDVDPLGVSNVKARVAAGQFELVRMWKYDVNLRDEVYGIIRGGGSNWEGSPNLWVVSNVAGLWYDLFNLLPVL